MPRGQYVACAAAGLLLLAGFDGGAAEVEKAATDEIEEVIVWGRATKQRGIARSATEGAVGYADFSTRPFQRVGELVEVVPGMVATQHSGEGKANQYFLRGMNLDHGTDFSTYFEGMPINLRAHAHGQGYLDLNFLIPEIIRTVDYAKGPYFPDRGDFSTAGSASVALYETIDPFLEYTVGQDSFHRVVAAGSGELPTGTLLGALEITRNDGPWQLPADVEKQNALLKYTADAGGAHWAGTLALYDNEWASTDQIPRRRVETGEIDRFGFVDPTIGGRTSRYSGTLTAYGADWTANVYLSRYSLNLFGNFTYFAEDPVSGDQHEQVDRRWIYGGHAARDLSIGSRDSVRLGIDARVDAIGTLDLYKTRARERLAVTRADDVDWRNLGVYVDWRHDWTDRLRTNIGLRVDHYDFDVDAQLPVNSGTGNDSEWLPSLSVAYAATDALELFANWGRGFHSNDVRGVTITTDPASGGPADSVALFVGQEGADIGLRFEDVNGNNITFSWFWLVSDSELLFVGDSGSTEPSDGSRRTGIELAAFWQWSDRFSADLSISDVDSRFTGLDSSAVAIPNAHGRVVNSGIAYLGDSGFSAALRVRHFGDAPLIEDGSVRHGATTVINLGVSQSFGPWEIGLEVINALDAEDDDIAYWFESRLSDESAPVEDVHFHPVDPLTFRVSLRWSAR